MPGTYHPSTPSVSSPSSPKRGGNPTGARVAQPAKTYPPRFPRLRFFAHGRKPTPEEWQRMQAHFAAHPEDRIRRGEQHMEGENLYFIAYNKFWPNGEEWGTKEKLADTRIRAAAAVRRSHRKKMKADPQYRAVQMERLSALVARQEAIDEADAEKKAALAKRKKVRAAAARSMKRKAKREAGKKSSA